MGWGRHSVEVTYNSLLFGWENGPCDNSPIAEHHGASSLH